MKNEKDKTEDHKEENRETEKARKKRERPVSTDRTLVSAY